LAVIVVHGEFRHRSGCSGRQILFAQELLPYRPAAVPYRICSAFSLSWPQSVLEAERRAPTAYLRRQLPSGKLAEMEHPCHLPIQTPVDILSELLTKLMVAVVALAPTDRRRMVLASRHSPHSLSNSSCPRFPFVVYRLPPAGIIEVLSAAGLPFAAMAEDKAANKRMMRHTRYNRRFDCTLDSFRLPYLSMFMGWITATVQGIVCSFVCLSNDDKYILN
jgi:hypothetical protein